MNEIWKDIEGYKGIYQISTLGRVRSLARTYWHGNRWYSQKEKILRQCLCTSGYMSVMLYDTEHKSKRIMVHTLVARAFIENSRGLKEVNHKDENKQNNVVDNLEWCDRLYNANYGTGRDRWYKAMLKTGLWHKDKIKEETK